MIARAVLIVANVLKKNVWPEGTELMLMKHKADETEFTDVKFNLGLLLLLVMVA